MSLWRRIKNEIDDMRHSFICLVLVFNFSCLAHAQFFVPEERVEEDVTIRSQSFTIHGVDVGTGLAIVVEGNDFVLIYDGGSNDDTALGYENRLTAYLRAAIPSLTRVDHLILSHPHTDLVLFLADVISEGARISDSPVILGATARLRFLHDKPGGCHNIQVQIASDGTIIG